MQAHPSTFLRTSACLLAAAAGLQAEGGTASKFRVDVDMVVLNFTVTDGKGRFVSGLTARDIRLFEDGITQRIASFAEGSAQPAGRPEAAEGNNVFILFDTSNCMYEGFVYAQDAIAQFIRNLDPHDRVAVYGFSQNLTRAAPLGGDRFLALRGLRNLTAGAGTALYNSLLLTLRDAARLPGRKMVVVFSNGPDNASVVAPDDVRRVAEEEGIPIYVVSTHSEAISDAVSDRITALTGGKFFHSRKWQRQNRVFSGLRDDLAHSYTVTYYPQPNPNDGFREIRVEVTNGAGKEYRIRARPGYRPKPG
ncbi:MAG: VWA domain-containing protein [Bryobacterales bacterium]|nr:VWA domain-containing protein [Bryobacterales bacterium]